MELPEAWAAPASESQVIIANTNAPGSNLYGTLQNPSTGPCVTEIRKIIVLCHGFAVNRDFGFFRRVAEATGLPTFRFDFAGCGKSEGTFPGFGGYKSEPEQLRAVVTFWKSHGVEVTAIVGHSKGGNVSLLYATQYDDVKSVVSICARFDMSRGLRERLGEDRWAALQSNGTIPYTDPFSGVSFQITRDMIEDRMSVNVRGVAQLFFTKVHVIHGDRDRVIPVEDAGKLHECLPLSCRGSLTLLPGVGHAFISEEERKLVLSALAAVLRV
eukprot:NODE_3305_length_1001_cov_29.659664_g3039_i0.p1 GENE.NODE_3305_length_1001_cov_29.659664_g3039_i0~~NODE_3305_length_1001_cov_29.659664_g3039_i0.p1  ORF type:complete len:271 (-),score=47.94 NODE_3305_length_1001_cov_29.659664_g3039_i0:140-952(-)